MRIEIVEGDLTDQPDIDAIVNAANAVLLGGGGVDGAIHRAAGPQLLVECRQAKASLPDGLLAPGRAVVTGAGNLPNRWVVHTVGPNRHRGQRDPAVLASCFRSSATLATSVGARSIAFPAIGAGAYGWDMAEVAALALEAIRDLPPETTGELDLVRFVLFDAAAAGVWRLALADAEATSVGRPTWPPVPLRHWPIAGLPTFVPSGRTLIMGVVNVTPDSFSDGGEWFEQDAAIAHGRDLLAAGADLLDVGGESTRPGAARVSERQELDRILPVITELAAAGAVVSVDTMRARVAEAALAAGAAIVNDVSGGLADPDMAAFMASVTAPYIAMHWRAPSDRMDDFTRYDDVVRDVLAELGGRLAALADAGISLDRVIVDPGLGFAKTGAQNWTILSRIGELDALRRPVLLGASRKRFLGWLLAGPNGQPVPPKDRDEATAAITALAAAAGTWCVRVHDVPGSVAAARVANAWRNVATEG